MKGKFIQGLGTSRELSCMEDLKPETLLLTYSLECATIGWDFGLPSMGSEFGCTV